MSRQTGEPDVDELTAAIRQLRQAPVDEERLVSALGSAKRAVTAARSKRGGAGRERLMAVHMLGSDLAGDAEGAGDMGPFARWRAFVRSHRFKLGTAAAAVVAVGALLVMSLPSAEMAYASEQTVTALKTVRYLHVVKRDEAGNIDDERWMELNADGRQIRYRQEARPDRLVIDNGKTTLVARKDHNAVILYSHNAKQHTWIGEFPAQTYEQLAGRGFDVLEENVSYEGRPAHRVRYRTSPDHFYIDPETKLPLAYGPWVISYDEPPAGTFRIATPEGMTVVDRRLGADPVSEPEWLKQETRDRRAAAEHHVKAMRLVAEGDFASALPLLTSAVALHPDCWRSWLAIGWGHYSSGDYDAAIRAYTQVLEIMTKRGFVAIYSSFYYARGLAYARKGMIDEATKDIRRCLADMVYRLRRPQRTWLLDYAEHPAGSMRFTKQQMLARMINRLRQVTGQNFGYDPAMPEQTEHVITAWEKWCRSQGQVRFDFEAKLVPVPAGSARLQVRDAHLIDRGKDGRIADGPRTQVNQDARRSQSAPAFAPATDVAARAPSSSAPSDARRQTTGAFDYIRYMHLIRRDETGKIVDERWIEIGPDGRQVQYRQDLPPHFTVVEDAQAVCAHYKEWNTIVLWHPRDRHYQWVAHPGQLFRDLAGEGSVVVARNVTYRGRPAHRVRWLQLGFDCHIDPETRLPFACGAYEISYEAPPEDTFKIAIPKGVKLIDKRPGRSSVEDPWWMVKWKLVSANLGLGRQLLGAGRHALAAKAFRFTIELEPPGQTWAWFWLGRAEYELGHYDQAIEAYSNVIDLFAQYETVVHYCYLARGLAYRKKGMTEAAKKDFGIAMEGMILVLRHVKGTEMFDYADDPLHRGRKRLSDNERLTRMIQRFREITGQRFGYSAAASLEQNDGAIAAWETWWRAHCAEYGVAPPGSRAQIDDQLSGG